MTVLTKISEISYAGIAGQDTFAYPFRVDLKTDMNITLDSVPVPQGDFSITGLGNGGGGEITLNTPLVANTAVVLFRQLEPTQETDYQPFDSFPAETHEGALDKLTMLVQQNEASNRRSLRFPQGEPTDPILPDIPSRQSKFLGFDVNGETVALSGTGGGDPNAVQKPAAVVIPGNLMVFDAGKNAVDSGKSITTVVAGLPVLLSTITANNSSTLDFTSNIDPTVYKRYRVEFYGLLPVTESNNDLRMQVSQGAGFITDPNYESIGFFQASYQLSDVADWGGGATGNGRLLAFGDITIAIADGATQKEIAFSGVSLHRGSAGIARFRADHSSFTNDDVTDGFRFFFTTGNILSGVFKLFGLPD